MEDSRATGNRKMGLRKLPERQVHGYIFALSVIVVFIILSVVGPQFAGIPGLGVGSDGAGYQSLHDTDRALRCWTASDNSDGRGDSLESWDRDGPCSLISMDRRIDHCNNWYIDHPVRKLDCTYTQEGVSPVTYIPDPGNHITTPFGAAEHQKTVVTANPPMDHPQDIEFFSDGRMLIVPDQHGSLAVMNQTGEFVHRMHMQDYVDAEAVLPDGQPAKVKGVAVDPNFEDTGHVYVYYSITNMSGSGFTALTDQHTWTFRVSRFTLRDGELQNQAFYLNVSGAFWHSGGGVEIGPDGKLYVTIGDGYVPDRGQALDTYRGKVLRLNRDGSIPDDNPFPNSSVYTYGHRNPQGIAWNPETGTPFAVEHGNWRHDELNRLVPGENYGWGRFSCDTLRHSDVSLRTEDYRSPVRCYRNWTLAPSRAAFVDDPGHPWHGDLFVASLRGKHVRRYRMDGDRILDERIFYIQEEPRPDSGMSRRFRDIEFFDGALWVLGNGGGLAKIVPDS